MRNHREAEMRVDVGVAVPGKMLQLASMPACCRPREKRRNHFAGPRRILAERADVDHRVARVDVDVGDRREIDVHAERP